MKQSIITILLTVLMSMTETIAFAHNIEAKNADGKTIYYIWTNNKTELAVSYRGSNYHDFRDRYKGKVVIPESVKYNGSTYPVTSIGKDAFSGCSPLTSVVIPTSVTSIGKFAFANCSRLTSITIPNSVTYIDGGALIGCTDLPSITIPNSVTSISDEVFCGCSGLTSVTIPNSVTSIGKSAFMGCDGLTTVTIPNSVTSIGDYAFAFIYGLTSITISNSVKSIGECAFKNCESLTSINIPNSVTSIGKDAFSETAWYNTQPDGVVYAGKVVYTYKGKESMSYNSQIIIEEGTLGISDYAFSEGCLASITIPSSLKAIGNYAFYGCRVLSSVTIPNGVTSIGKSAFAQCWDLSSVTIPSSIKVIDDYTFQGCRSLTSIAIPNSLSTIGDYAFENCSSLTSVDIPNSVTSIGFSAFDSCTSLASITIPNSVEYIGRNAFRECRGLNSVTIGSGVTNIGSDAFSKCEKMSDVYSFAPKLTTNIYSYLEHEGLYTEENAFNSPDPEYLTLHVPSASIEEYRTISPWNRFGNIVALTDDDPSPTGIKTLKEENPNYPVGIYSLDGKRLQKEQRGLNIIRMNDGSSKIILKK